MGEIVCVDIVELRIIVYAQIILIVGAFFSLWYFKNRYERIFEKLKGGKQKNGCI